MHIISNILKESKSVCIVGNAQAILGSKQGGWIDSFDSVVRMNRGFPKKKKDQGSKTDIIALSCSIKEGEYNKYYGSPPVAWMTPNHEGLPDWISADRLDFYPVEYWDKLYGKLDQHRPSTGAMVIDLLSNYIRCEKLRIIGFDFKTTQTLFEKKEHRGPHDWELEREFALSTISTAKNAGLDWEIV